MLTVVTIITTQKEVRYSGKNHANSFKQNLISGELFTGYAIETLASKSWFGCDDLSLSTRLLSHRGRGFQQSEALQTRVEEREHL